MREAWEILEWRVVAEALDVLSAVAADRNAAERAATLAGAAAGIRGRGRTRPRAYPAAAEVAANGARAALGAGRFEELAAAGAELSDEGAVAYALDAGERESPPSQTSATREDTA